MHVDHIVEGLQLSVGIDQTTHPILMAHTRLLIPVLLLILVLSVGLSVLLILI